MLTLKLGNSYSNLCLMLAMFGAERGILSMRNREAPANMDLGIDDIVRTAPKLSEARLARKIVIDLITTRNRNSIVPRKDTFQGLEEGMVV